MNLHDIAKEVLEYTVAAYGLHGSSSSDPVIRLNRGARSGLASFRA